MTQVVHCTEHGILSDRAPSGRGRRESMNLICKVFGHNFGPIEVSQEKTITDATEKIKWSSIVICPRCGEEVPLEAVKTKED